MRIIFGLLVSQILLCGGPPDTEFRGISSARFAAGSRIHVPSSAKYCEAFHVRVPDPAGLLKSTFRLQLCGRSLPAEITVDKSAVVLTATTREAIGLFADVPPCEQSEVSPACELKVTSTRADIPFRSPAWTLCTWQKPYVESNASQEDGVMAPVVRIDAPVGGAVNRPDTPKGIVVKGAVLNQGDFLEVEKQGGYRVSVAGKEADRSPARGHLAFEAHVNLEPGTKEVEVFVQHPRGSITRLLLPVLR
jgi:hypothetical protein